jgi:hypothetical protein
VFKLLRRFQPKNRPLAILYWVFFTVAALAAILIGYYFLDKVVPQGGY